MHPPQESSENDVVVASEYVADDNKETMAEVALIVGFIAFPMTMQAAIELGILEIIATAGLGAQLTAVEVAAKLPVKENTQAADMVDRMLRLLATFSVVSCSVVGGDDEGGERRRVYGLTPVGRYFVKDEDGLSMGPLLKFHQDRVLMASWCKLKDVVLEGGTAFNMAHGITVFEHSGLDERFNEVFNVAMFNHSSLVMKKIIQSYNGFESLSQLVDVGGGLGHDLKTVLSKYPNIKGINFDLPHVTKHGIPHPGMEHIGGDMFESVPSTETIFMKWILHNWSDECCIKLLKNCHKAIPNNGKVIVVEFMVPDKLETSNAAKVVQEMDMIMMIETPGGRERTEKEFLALAKAAGFASINIECYICNSCVMEFYK